MLQPRPTPMMSRGLIAVAVLAAVFGLLQTAAAQQDESPEPQAIAAPKAVPATRSTIEPESAAKPRANSRPRTTATGSITTLKAQEGSKTTQAPASSPAQEGSGQGSSATGETTVPVAPLK